MQSKSIFLSVTFWGAALSGLLAVIDHLTGVKVNDQVGPLESALTELVQALLNALPSFTLPIAHLVAVLTIIVGRFRAIQPVHILPPAGKLSFPGAVSVLVGLTVLISAAGLAGCATAGGSGGTPGTPPVTQASNASAFIEESLPLVRTGAAVATGAVLDFAVQQTSTRTRLANEMYAAASGTYSLTGGTFPTPAQFQSSILAFGGTQADASYAQFSTAIAALYAAYFPKLQTGDTKTATDLLNAIAGGIEDATQSYVTVPATAVPTTLNWDGAEAARVAHNHEDGGSSPSPSILYELHPVARDKAGNIVYSF